MDTPHVYFSWIIKTRMWKWEIMRSLSVLGNMFSSGLPQQFASSGELLSIFWYFYQSSDHTSAISDKHEQILFATDSSFSNRKSLVIYPSYLFLLLNVQYTFTCLFPCVTTFPKITYISSELSVRNNIKSWERLKRKYQQKCWRRESTNKNHSKTFKTGHGVRERWRVNMVLY